MAEPGRTIRVSSLPTDIEDKRLKDKLFIHFLRERNGGGEIDSIVIDRAGSALITFEDSGMAQRIIQRRRHTLEVDEKKYKLAASEHRERLDPDQVILNLTATVDCRLLPGGVTALIRLSKSHDVRINFTPTQDCWTIQGSYSVMQAALTQLLVPPGGQESANKNASDSSAPSSSRSVQTSQMTRTKDSEDEPVKQREKHRSRKISDERDSSSSRKAASGDKDRNERSKPDSPPSSSAEDCTLIMDADVFQYLHQLCRKEYQDILDRYNIEAEDLTSQGLTTLLLKATQTEKGGEQERLRQAKQAIGQLYLENECKICRGELSKRILFNIRDLQKAMKFLRSKYPKLLLNEDEQNVYIIGSSSDVSAAKRLLLGLEEDGIKLEQVSSDLSPKDPVSHCSVEEQSPVVATSAEGCHNKILKLTLRSSESDRKREPSKTYTLAARFKHSGITGLGDRPRDFTTNLLTSKQAQIRSSANVPVETSDISGKEFTSVLPQNTGEDILFKSRDTASPIMANTLPPMDSQYQLSPRLSSLSGGSAPSPPGSGQSLKRANSFSGTLQEKSPKSPEDSSKLTVRGRSSSFGGKTAKPKQQVHSEEISDISQVMWLHINDAYRTRVEELTSDLQMTECTSPDSKNLTLILRGADFSKVMSCKQRLQRLVDSVRSDFSVNKVNMTDLDVFDMADETLLACLSEIKNSYKKVTVHSLDNGFFLLGPKEMCNQIQAILLEVFERDPGRHHYSNPYLQMNAGQSNSLYFHNNFQRMLETQTAKANRTDDSLQWKTTYSSDFGKKELANGSLHPSPVTKENIPREKVRSPSVPEAHGSKSRRPPHGNVSATSSDAFAGFVNGIAPRIAEKERTGGVTPRNGSGLRLAETENSPDQYSSSQKNPVGSCVCGEKMESSARTKCGLIVCQKCLRKHHVTCSVCPKTDQTPQGIEGQMKVSKLDLMLPGYNQYGVIKITYTIPDGFQGASHPSPGKPFRGGTFEAFFPDCDAVRKLLPRLQEAFKRGLTFTVKGNETDAKVVWNAIPHKTSLHEGKAKGGYPDSTYLTVLSDTLKKHGIE
ncbi:hypothetical protein OJAV_G00081610 [Oryzias javanicus]|uniref:RING-type E3 ubiquitin transferase n=1 Tax=Oryzias javanicus TaxID=123683 RepID=A0A3S2PLG0_ORYJA|nr:hypothetical protein OJAV_G00081610 [Oryzias javanicus]